MTCWSRFYHSQYDNADNVNLDAICQASSTLARSLFLLASGSNADSVTPLQLEQIDVQCETVSQLFQCLAVNTSCDLLNTFYNKTGGLGSLPPASRYAGVYSKRRVQLIAKFVYDWILFQTSPLRTTIACTENSQCKDKVRGASSIGCAPASH
jgi:hypothetical protein